jgi:diguanylate cyclase (GGDEF)-like protein
MSWLLRRIGSLSPVTGAVVMVAGIVFVGMLDLATGIEVRVYPLYFLPLSIGAWTMGGRGAWAGSVLAAAAWYVSNRLAGLVYTSQVIWLWNLAAQTFAFLTVSLLIARMRYLLDFEGTSARTDALTGLDNRRAFFEHLEQVTALARRHDHPVTIAYLDLDNFKSVNDILGHRRGDDLLRSVAQVLRAALRRSDRAARVGGDEFVVCLPETGEAGARVVLDRVFESLTAAIHAPGCSVSVSIGAVAWSRPPATVEGMLLAADELMYDVKRAGKNGVRIISREPDRATAAIAGDS